MQHIRLDTNAFTKKRVGSKGVHIMSRRASFVVLVLVVLTISVFPVSAELPPDPDLPDTVMIETDDYGYVLAIADGRLNGVDVAAPVAIYYTYGTALAADGHGYQIATGIDVLAIDPKTNNGVLMIHATTADVNNLMNGTLSSLEVNGYSLHYSVSNEFWVQAPADREGKVYTFQWENLSFPTPAAVTPEL
jgi:hypothetical protein